MLHASCAYVIASAAAEVECHDGVGQIRQKIRGCDLNRSKLPRASLAIKSRSQLLKQRNYSAPSA